MWVAPLVHCPNRPAHNWGMNRRLSLFLALALGVLPARGLAFGLSVVFDPTAFSQMLTDYALQKLHLGALGTMVGLNTAQLTTLNQLQTSVGAGVGAINQGSLTQNQMSSIAQSLGLDPQGFASSLYVNAGPFQGSLNVFMGSDATQWQAAVATPNTNFGNWAMSNSLSMSGGAAGLTDPETSFAQQVAALPPEQRAFNQSQIAMGVAEMSHWSYQNRALQRRTTIQAEQNLSQQAATHASNATSVNDSMAASNELAARTNSIIAAHALQDADAHEASMKLHSATNAQLGELTAARARSYANDQLSGGPQ